MISDSENNPNRLFFRCKKRRCHFFQWWMVEQDNEGLEHEHGGSASILNAEYSSNSVRTVDVGHSNRDRLEDVVNEDVMAAILRLESKFVRFRFIMVSFILMFIVISVILLFR